MAENIIKFPTPEEQEINKAIEETLEEADRKERGEERAESAREGVEKLREVIKSEHLDWTALQIEEEIAKRTGIQKEAGELSK